MTAHHFNKGRCIGGCRTLADLHGRCVIDGETECWHFRKADGKPYPRKSKKVKVHIFQLGQVSAARAAWAFHTGSWPPPGELVYRKCTSHDCINPKHLGCGSFKDWGKTIAAAGHLRKNPIRSIVGKRNIASRRIINDELLSLICESTQSATEMAQVLDVNHSTVCKWLKKAEAKATPRSIPVATSVFDFRGSITVAAQPEPIQKARHQVRNQKGWNNSRAKFTHQQLMAMIARYDAIGARHQASDCLKWRDPVSKAGRETVADIARDYGTSRAHVWRIATGRLWSDVTGRTPEDRRG